MIKKTYVGVSKVTGEKVYKIETGKYVQRYILETGAEIRQDKIEFTKPVVEAVVEEVVEESKPSIFGFNK